MSDNLSKVFNTGPVKYPTAKEDVEVVSNVVPMSDQTMFEDDYQTTRDNLHALIKEGEGALDIAIRMARDSESPRAIEVVGNLIKQLADVNHQLLELTEKKKKISTQAGPSTVNNTAYFVGSTKDLKKLINDIDKGE